MSQILTAGVVRAVTQAASSAKPARAVAARAHGEPTRFAINRRQPDPDHIELKREHTHATQQKEDPDKDDDDGDDGDAKDVAEKDAANGDDDDDDHDERAKSIKWFEVGGGTQHLIINASMRYKYEFVALYCPILIWTRPYSRFYL